MQWYIYHMRDQLACLLANDAHTLMDLVTCVMVVYLYVKLKFVARVRLMGATYALVYHIDINLAYHAKIICHFSLINTTHYTPL